MVMFSFQAGPPEDSKHQFGHQAATTAHPSTTSGRLKDAVVDGQQRHIEGASALSVLPSWLIKDEGSREIMLNESSIMVYDGVWSVHDGI